MCIHCFNFYWFIGFFLGSESDLIKQRRLILLEAEQKNNGVVKIIQLDSNNWSIIVMKRIFTNKNIRSFNFRKFN